MSSEICVPYCFNAWNLRTSAFMMVIWTWIGVGRRHPWFTLTLWLFRGPPRSSEVDDLRWRHLSFSFFYARRGNLVRWFWMWHPFAIRMYRNGVIGILKYRKEKWQFLRFIWNNKIILLLTYTLYRYSDEDEIYQVYYFYIFEVNWLHYNMSIRLSYYSIFIIIMLKHAIAHLQFLRFFSSWPHKTVLRGSKMHHIVFLRP